MPHKEIHLSDNSQNLLGDDPDKSYRHLSAECEFLDLRLGFTSNITANADPVVMKAPTHPLRGPAGTCSLSPPADPSSTRFNSHNSVTSQYLHGLPAYPGRQAPVLGDPRPVSPRVLSLRPCTLANRPTPGVCGHVQGLLPPPRLHPNARELLPQALVSTEAASGPVKP